MTAAPLLRVEGLTTVLHLPSGTVPVVDRVDLAVTPGETLGIVGESGCGKSMLALSLIGLQPNPPAEITGGTAEFENTDLLDIPPGQLRDIGGRRIGMIFQDHDGMKPVSGSVTRSVRSSAVTRSPARAPAWRRAGAARPVGCPSVERGARISLQRGGLREAS